MELLQHPRDDGQSYQDHIEQLTFLLFLKMADDRQKLFPGRAAPIPRALDWQSVERPGGDDLNTQDRHILAGGSSFLTDVGWEYDAENRSLVLLAVNEELGVMELGDPLGDCQPQSAAFHLAA